jgi:hypothetical protein
MEGAEKAGVVLEFPRGDVVRVDQLIVPKDLRRRISAVARRMRWNEEEILRCMLEEALRMATKRA